ncbi:MAG: hypothetical protein K5931_06905 [Lachnospiraceae bacterium]|nr:hypothetical protein [Lachnospiraceae bacterium]
MATLNEGMRMMIENIDNYCELLLVNKRQEALQYRDGLIVDFSTIISAMLPLYDKPEHADVKDDKDYWIAQFDRIKDAMYSDDSFFTMDVLKNETKENFLLYLKMIDK